MKKLIGLFALLFASVFIFTSCQKDFSAEGGIAKGSLAKDAAGDCMPATPNGTFKKDTILRANNYVDIKVNITKVGVYTIASDTVNGYSFKAVGTTAIAGANTIRLLGKGKPLATGTNVFKIKFDGTECQFNITVLDSIGGIGTPVARFTLGNTAGGCTSTVSGTYAQGLATSASNTVTIAITTQQAGTYAISTSATNGVIYAATGTLALGATSITLIANAGTPTAAGTFAHILTAGTSTCSFDITYTGALAVGVFTFNCGMANVQGDYVVGTAMNASNTITIPVTITTPGTYNITIAAVNGISFAGSGVVNAGSPTVMLTASGNPATVAPSVHNATGGGSPSCSVTIFSQPPVIMGMGFIRARIGSATAALTTFNTGIIVSNNSVNDIGFSGNNNATGSEFIGVDILAATGVVININYTVNLLSTGVLLDANYTSATNVDFSATTNFIPQPISPFTVRFTTIITTGTAKRIVGTFSGRMKDSGTTNLDFFGGEFDITF